MLKRLKVDNFKCLDGFEIEFEGHALLMGLNGSGKSTVVEVLDRLQQFVGVGLKAGECFPASTRTRWRSDTTQTFEMDVENDAQSFKYRVVLGQTEKGAIVIDEEELTAPGCSIHRRRGTKTIVDNGPGDSATGQVLVPDELAALPLLTPTSDGVLTPLDIAWLHLAGISSYRFAPSTMEGSTKGDRVLRAPDTRNIASWIHAQPVETRRAIAKTASLALPSFLGLEFTPEGDQFRLMTKWNHPAGTRTFAFDELSDGQRLVITLAALGEIPEPMKANTLVLDEPDNYVALQEIQPLLLSMLDAPNLQLIVASHHPEVIDLMAKDYGYVFSREDDVGPVRVKRWKAPEGTMLPPSELVARGDIDGGA